MLLRLRRWDVFVHDYLRILSLIPILRVSTSAVLKTHIGHWLSDTPLTVKLGFGQLVDHQFHFLFRNMFTFSEWSSLISFVHAW